MSFENYNSGKLDYDIMLGSMEIEQDWIWIQLAWISAPVVHQVSVLKLINLIIIFLCY